MSDHLRAERRPTWPFDDFTSALLDAALDGAEEKVGVDPVVLAMAELMDAFEALVIVAGRNDRQVRAIAEEVERVVGERTGIKPLRVEGRDAGEWIALDYGDIIVHVFDEAVREYYDLEHLWNAAPSFRRSVAE